MGVRVASLSISMRRYIASCKAGILKNKMVLHDLIPNGKLANKHVQLVILKALPINKKEL